jgi:hypothetical protein
MVCMYPSYHDRISNCMDLLHIWMWHVMGCYYTLFVLRACVHLCVCVRARMYACVREWVCVCVCACYGIIQELIPTGTTGWDIAWSDKADTLAGVLTPALKHTAPASSEWKQLWAPHARCAHSSRDGSLPAHLTSSSQIVPLPSPNRPPLTALPPNL